MPTTDANSSRTHSSSLSRSLGHRRGMTLRQALWTVFFFSVLFPVGTSLQGQYTPPGRPTDQGGIPDREELEESVENARWNLGKLRLTPWLGLRNVGFVSNVTTQPGGDGDDDFTATVGAGLRAYLRTGSRVIWAAQALPEYTWWQDSEAKRRLNGRYGLGVFGYFNRLELEASVRRVEVQTFFTPELQQLTSNRQEELRLEVDFEFLRRLHLVLSNEIQDIENQEDENLVFSLLDRERDTVQALLRYQSDRFIFGLGYADTTTDFASQARRLSNTETAEIVELAFDGARFDAALSLARRCREPDAGSEFQPREETTGYLDLLFETGDRSSLLTYARRDLYYSILNSNSSVLGSRYGARFEIGGRRLVLAWFAEVGEDEFDTVLLNTQARTDDVTSAGAELNIKFRRLFRAGVRISQTDYDSNFDLFDRDFLTIAATIEVSAFLERLRLGKEGDDW